MAELNKPDWQRSAQYQQNTNLSQVSGASAPRSFLLTFSFNLSIFVNWFCLLAERERKNSRVVTEPVNARQQFTVESQSTPWTWSSLIVSMVSLCCCVPFGIIGTVMAILAYVDHATLNFERSKAKRNVALGFGIAAIVIGSVILLIYIIVLCVSLSAG